MAEAGGCQPYAESPGFQGWCMEVESGASAAAQQGGTSNFDAFLQTGRTGRRNAVPDILDRKTGVSTASLPAELEKLSCSDPGAGTSGLSRASAGTSSQSPQPQSPGTSGS